MIWHYTAGDSFRSIFYSKVIRPATARIATGEKPIVWFSTEKWWEPTVTKGRRRPDGTIEDLGMHALHVAGFMLWRIGVAPETAPYTWSELKELSGMPSDVATRLATIAKQMGGNASRWRGTFTPVHAELWKTIEFFSGSAWITLDPKTVLE